MVGDGIEQVELFKCLGVIFQHSLSFESHVVSLLKQCSQRIYLLKMLRSQGIPLQNSVLSLELLLSHCLTYIVCPACLGYSLSSQSGRIDAFFKRAYRCGLAGELFTVDDLLYSSATGLFKKMRHSTHCLNHLLPPIKSTDYVLRNSGQSYILPQCNYQSHKNSFVNWCLFN